MSKSKIGLPAVHHSLTKGKSYYSGPFTKLDQITLPESRIYRTNNTVVRDKSHSKERIFMQDTFDLSMKPKVLKTEPDSVQSRWTPSSKEIMMISKRRIKQSEDSQGRASALSSIKQHLQGRKKKTVAPPSIETYLTYLESKEDQRTANFTEKLRKRSKNRDEMRNHKDSLSSLFYEKYSPLARGSQLEIETRPDSKTPIHLMLGHSPSINLLSREANTPTALIKRTSSLNKSPLRSRSTMVPKMFYDFNKDEIIALEISQVVAKNYKASLETAARNGATNAKIVKLLQKSGVSDIFNDRLFGHLPLNRRIYNDIFESSDSSPIARSPSKKMDPGRKINKVKLANYKSVNQELVQIITEFKVQDLKTLESTLNQAHDNFVFKKKVFLKNVKSLDFERYKNVKDKCDKVEKVLAWCDEYPLNSNEKTYRPEDSELDSEAMILNRELDSIMSHWRDKLYTQQY